MNLLFEIKKLKKLTIAFFWLGIGSASQVWPQANEKINAFQKLSQAAFFMQKEQYEQALVALEQLHALDTTLIISWFYKGKAYYHLKKYEQASLALEKFIRSRNKLEISLEKKELALVQNSQEMLAECWVEMGAFEKALALYDTLLLKSPENVNLLFNRGRCRMALGQKHTACQDFQQAAALGHPAAYTWEKQYCKN